MANSSNPTSTKPARRRKKPTELEMSAVTFAGLLAQNVDQNRGIKTEYGTPETQAKVIAEVKETFFKYSKEGD
jgi:hypothetical protein